MGYSVQLKHDEIGMDYISLEVGDQVIARADKIQSNQNFRSLASNSVALVEEFDESMDHKK